MKFVVMFRHDQDQDEDDPVTDKRQGSRSPQFADAKARLAAHLVRMRCNRSRARDVVVDAFLQTPGHVSVEELTAIVRERTPRVGYSTVYRTMKLLAECGVAAAQTFGDGHTRYERVLEGKHHDHLICTSCGAVTEFEDPTIEELQGGVARRYGYQIASHRMELYGLCARCASGASSSHVDEMSK